MKNKAGHRILSILLTLVLLCGGLPVTAFAEDGCTHVCGDGICSYAEGADCGYVHVHDENCGYDADTDSECADAHTHDDQCGYIEPTDCNHVHDGNCGGIVNSANTITFDIPLNEYGETAFYLPENEPLTDADLLAGVTAADENGDPVTVTVKDVDGLNMQNPAPKSAVYPNPPYVITYAAAHPLSGDEFTETRECYVTAAVAVPTAGSGASSSDPCQNGSDLQDAINAASSGDTIYVQSMTYYSTITIPNNTNVTIAAANGTDTLTAPAGIRHFRLDSGSTATLTFTGVTLDGGGSGGGISNYGGLTLNGVTISYCYIGTFGGGIFSSGSGSGTTLTLDGVTISNCRSSNNGGAIENNGGTVTIINSTITGNTAANAGGGIYSNSGTVTIGSGSTVSGNTAASYSGIFNSVYGTFNIGNGCTVSGGVCSLGTLNNSGTITSPSGQTLSNFQYPPRYGTVNNNGTITIDSGGTFENQSNCIVNNNSGGIITNNGTFDNQGTINNYPGGTLNNVSGGTINQIVPPPPPPPSPPPTPSGRDSGSSRGNTTTAVKSAPTSVTKQEAMDAFNKALSSLTPGQTTVTVRLVNYASIPPDVLKALADAAKKVGVTVIIHADTVSDGAVQTRMYIDPAKSEKEIMLAAADSPDAVNAASRFKSRFTNKLTAVSTGQQGSFGQPVGIAVKVDLTGMDTENLVFYSYDKATNTYKRIENPAYWIDKNGYLHFTTELAGDIIISDGPLEKKT